MKSRLTFLLTLVVGVLVVICTWQQHKLRKAAAQVVELQRELQTESEGRIVQENRATALLRRQTDLNGQVSELTAIVGKHRESEVRKPLPIVAHPSPSASENERRTIMISQQRSDMISRYGPLIKQLNLSSDDKEKLMEILASRHFDDAGKERTGESLKGVRSQSDESIKQLLGEDGFTRYQRYEDTMGERLKLEGFQKSFEGMGGSLSDDQLNQLIAVIEDENLKTPSAPAAHFQETVGFSGELLDRQLAWQETINQHLVERAGQFLTAEQLEAYSQFQARLLNMQKIGMKQASDMWFGGNNWAGVRIDLPRK